MKNPIKVEIALKDSEPIGTLLKCFVNLLMEIETTEYISADGVKLTNTLPYKESAQNILRLYQEENNETGKL